MEKNKINISIMNINDLEKIKDILTSDFDNFWTYDILKEELNSNFSTYIIASNNNEILGFCGIKIIVDEADLMNIVVKKNFRHCNIASLMLEYIIDLCTQKNIKKINLEVNVKNTIAINLYKKYNFIQVGYRKNYYNGIDDAILMCYNITDKICKYT